MRRIGMSLLCLWAMGASCLAASDLLYLPSLDGPKRVAEAVEKRDATPAVAALPSLSRLASARGGWQQGRADSPALRAALGKGVTVSLRPLCVVRGTSILLGDVAEILGADDALKKKLGAVRLATSPRVGQRLRVTAQSVEAALWRDGLRAGVSVVGATGATVSRDTQVLQRESIRALVTEAILDRVGHDPKDVILRDWNLPEDASVPSGAVTTRIDLRLRETVVGTQTFSVTVGVDGGSAKTVRGSVFVDVMTPVVRTAAPLERGQTVRFEHLTSARAPLSSLPRSVVTSADQAIGKICARPVRAGGLLRTDLLRTQILVKRNDVVLMQLATKRMRLSTKGVAQGQGGMNDVIKVVNPTSGRETMARIVGPRKVEVVF